MLTFNFSKAIAITADQSNFGQGSGNKSDNTKGTAMLTASNSKNITSTTDRYNIYFIIESNDFVYTTANNKTELLLQVIDPNGNEVTAITGLLYKDGGFDITTRTGGFLLVPDYDISADRGETTIQDWDIKVTLVNLDTNQSANMGKSFSGKLYMTKDQMSSYELIEIINMNITTTYNSIDTTLEVTNGSAEIEKYYFGKEKISSNTTSMLSVNKLAVSDVAFVETTNSSYKFTNLDSNSKYRIYSYVVDKNGIKSNMYETEVVTEEYVLPTISSVTHTSTLNSITVNVTASNGSNEIVKYFYSKDNGETYTETTESSYTFTSLADTAQYQVKIKVQDTDGKFSTVYSESISTVTYILPTITSATATTKYNQITVNTTATNGTNNVSKYYYSINNGAFIEGSSSYTFTGLNEQTAYSIKVKVIDTQNYESVVYSLSATTDAYILPTVTIASTSSTSNSITINVAGTNGDGAITTYYYSKDNGSNYVSSTSSSYTFTGLTSNTTFYVKVYVKDANGRSSSVVITSINTIIPKLSEWVLAKYTGTQGENNLYYHNGTIFDDSGNVIDAEDNSYRYAGASDDVNNFVCFASDEETCPDDNLYRIIGVFEDQVKLIKWDYATSELLGKNNGYCDDYKSVSSNKWGVSKGLNDIKNIGAYRWYGNNTILISWSNSDLNTHLNNTFLKKIDDNWKNKISSNTWYIAGNTNLENLTPKEIYDDEIDINKNSTVSDKIYKDNVGMMYISDYGFAASPSTWSTKLSKYNDNSITEFNWMYMGLKEWTITRVGETQSSVYFIDYNGDVDLVNVTGLLNNDNCFASRPTFYLNTDVIYVSGTGVKSNPIRIN